MSSAIAAAVILSFAGISASAQAQSSQPTNDQMMQTVINACQQDLREYCSSVTPGRNRLLACIYAHQDKISANCLQSLYNNSRSLVGAITSMQHVAAACQAELQTRCANVAPGNGRVVQCLRNMGSQLSPGCRQSLQELSDEE